MTQRYRHEQLAFAGLDAADAATTLEDALTRLPGMLHARVSYAAGLLFVAYDRDQLDQTTIERTVKSLGARRPDQARSPSPGPVKQTVMPSMTTAVPLTFCPTGCRSAGH